MLLIIAALCSSLGAFTCSFLLTLVGILNILIAFALAIVLPIILYMNRQSLIDKLEKYMQISIKDFDDITENPVTLFWNELQEKYSCCGLNNSITDYRNSYFRNLTGRDVPQSCCRANILCSMSPTKTNSYIDISCIPQVKHFINSTMQITTIGDILLLILLSIVLISIGLFFIHIKSAKQTLNEHNEFIIKSMLSTLEQYEKELGGAKNLPSDETNFHDKQRIQGILPITPTVVRVKSPRIINYLGFN
ncbi:unnamed protein product [Adineta steineri]|uniref:Tetraspanin n=1 Tax=Adineta steineri TaxID=433720 RepID=A0A820HJP9_9BILA|nr:unnamed protein product [Adineta steineri]CAF4297123.1 unnamed protein product [Adineta steineri]